MRRWTKEPLLHLPLAAGVLFAAYALLDRGSADQPHVMRIATAEANWLKESWARQRLRPPSEQKLRAFVIDFLKEELLAVEAQEMGLDVDTIVRRSVRVPYDYRIGFLCDEPKPG